MTGKNVKIVPRYIKYIESSDIGTILKDDDAKWRLAQTFDFVKELKQSLTSRVAPTEQIGRTDLYKDTQRFIRKIISLLFYDYNVCPLQEKDESSDKKCKSIQMRPMLAANILITNATQNNIKKIEQLENIIFEVINNLNSLEDQTKSDSSKDKEIIITLLKVTRDVFEYYRSCLEEVYNTSLKKELINKTLINKTLIDNIKTTYIDKINDYIGEINTLQEVKVTGITQEDLSAGNWFTDWWPGNSNRRISKDTVANAVKLSDSNKKKTTVEIMKKLFDYFKAVKNIKEQANNIMKEVLEGEAAKAKTPGAAGNSQQPAPSEEERAEGGGKMPRKTKTKPATKKVSPYQKTPYKHTDKNGVERVVYTKGTGKYVRIMDKKTSKMKYKKVQ